MTSLDLSATQFVAGCIQKGERYNTISDIFCGYVSMSDTLPQRLSSIQYFPVIDRTNLILLCLRSPLWSSCLNFWVQIQRSRVRFRIYQIFWEVVGL
jgi:hypothetical protein